MSSDNESPLTVGGMPAGLEEEIGKFVRNLRSNFIQTKAAVLKVQLPFVFEVTEIPAGVKLTIKQDVEIDRPGINPWLDFIELHESGKVIVQAHKLLVTIREEVK